MEKGKFYLFKMMGWKTPIGGVVELIGAEWILIKHIVVDYALDGYSLLQKKYIKSYIQDDSVLFTEQVLLAKGIMDIRIPYDIPLNTQTAPFTWLKEHSITVQFNPKDSSICYVGKVGNMTQRFFELISMDPKGCWDTYFYKYTYATMRVIDIDCDYVNSLFIYNQKTL